MQGALANVFDLRLNGLNAVRLGLALSVIVWHSFVLSGSGIAFAPLRQLFEQLGVDGFFAISGYLIVSSWKRDPSWFRYLAARVLRIFPAFWVVLIVTAFAIAPVATMAVTGMSYTQVISFENVTYVLKNLGLVILQERIGDTPTGVPFTAAWNASLWTLDWEFLCYLGVMTLGLLRLLRYRATVPTLFGCFLVLVVLTSYGPIDNPYVGYVARFGIMFSAGMLIQQVAGRLKLNWWLLFIALVLTLGALFLPNYRLVGALPWAYTMIGLGALIKVPVLRLKNDISYGTYIYAAPLQQLLASCGVIALGVPIFALFSVAVTLVPATASWFAIERNALKLRPRRRVEARAQAVG